MAVSSAKQQPRVQKSIFSFFGSSRNIRKSNESEKKTHDLTTTKATRQNSIIPKGSNEYDQGFDDSHDTSMDTSYEFSNNNLKSTTPSFQSDRNIILKESTNYHESSNSHDSTSIHNKRFKNPSLKRSNSSVLDSMNLGQAKRIKSESSTVIKVAKSNINEIQLNKEQLAVVKAVVEDGLNVFYSGSAGTGKSIVLKEIVKRLSKKYGAHKIGVTAPTGMAACNIEGQTIYKFLHIGAAKLKADQLVKNINKNEFVKNKWLKLKVLIVDEVSMLDGDLFEKINQVGKAVRGSSKPFGGIQIVLSGDFYQLPPVNKDVRHKNFCFLKSTWNETVQKSIVLTEIFRQKGDSDFIDMLNALRNGNLTQNIVTKFMALRRTVNYDDGIVATELYSTKLEVSRANNIRLDQLESKQAYTYKAKDSHLGEQYRNQYNSLMCEEVLVLKEGAQVMMLKNIDERLVNGSQGHVLFFTTQSFYHKIMDKFSFIDPEDKDMINELRLVSSRIGKTDPYTDQECAIFKKCPPSRLPYLEELCQYAAMDSSSTEVLPVVNFKANGDNIVHLVTREDFIADNKPGSLSSSKSQVSRIQIPLLLSWAMSIHKSQGQTLDRVKIDLNKSFEEGQAYVAISRARSKDRLELKGFNPNKVLTSPIVIDFYRKIQAN
ncbi:unnamed protein product [Candida verbasci]|uniref:ATP-dependent DNA helicase PIF1 n=1 Tax=Candida verbasci TaxID=1227364 RepID=A0A9W4TRY8_9ASCO|nr:unnamed protein product [Candida verbasci]